MWQVVRLFRVEGCLGQAGGPWSYAKTNKQANPSSGRGLLCPARVRRRLGVWPPLVHALDCLLGLSGGFLFLGAFNVWGEPVTRSGQ